MLDDTPQSATEKKNRKKSDNVDDRQKFISSHVLLDDLKIAFLTGSAFRNPLMPQQECCALSNHLNVKLTAVSVFNHHFSAVKYSYSQV